MNSTIASFPLQWPAGYDRTPSYNREHSRWKQTLGKARDQLQDEARMMGAANLIISTNQPLKQNGDLRADAARFKVDDTGVAVYFDWKGKSYVMCCDRYRQIWENLYAIARTINALRQIDRDGVSEFLERAFTGFPGLPASAESMEQTCWEVLGLYEYTNSRAEIEKAYRAKAKEVHPDAGGTEEQMQTLNAAKKKALSTI